MIRGVFLLVVALAALLRPGSGSAQQIGVAVDPDTVLVGDLFRAAVRIDLPPGYRAELPDSLPVAGDVENAGRPSRTVEERPDGGTRLTVVYPLSAWRPGGAPIPPLTVVIEGPDAERKLQAVFPEVVVRSVLPPDTAGVDPRPPKDVLGASRLIWPIVLALLVVLAALVAAYVLYRRRRRPLAVAVAGTASPRERALEALDRARADGLVEAGDFKAFHSRVSDALRRFLEEVREDWSADHTTSELLESAASVLDDTVAAELAWILEAADLVKFARHRPEPAEALDTWVAARRWVDAFRLPAPEPAVEEPAPESVPAVAGSQEIA